MTLLERTHRHLARQGVAHAVIGAAALAAHGVSRSTLDIDLLVHGRRCLRPALWRGLDEDGVLVEIRTGDAEDPLAGVVRLESPGDRPIDVIVGRSPWQRGVIARAAPVRLGRANVPIARAADLVLLKLYAGGPQDRWDIAQLLAGDAAIVADVERELVKLPSRCRRLWSDLRPG